MKARFARFFPSDVTRSFDNTKKLSDYVGALARMVFIGPLALLTLYWTFKIEPTFSLSYASLLVVTAYFVVLATAMFLSFSWLTAGYIQMLLFGAETRTLGSMLIMPAVALLLIGALAVVLYEIAESSSIVKDAISLGDVLNPQ